MNCVAVVDYGLNNVQSVINALRRFNANVEVVRHGETSKCPDLLILPGVGSFGAGIDALSERKLDRFILRCADFGIPILGICLGMQMLGVASEESRGISGLGLVDSHALRLCGENIKVPHVGWNKTQIRRQDPIFNNLSGDPYMYYVHSYYLPECDDYSLAVTDHGVRFTSVLRQDNVWGVQFHPEKSADCGITLLRNFLLMTGE